MTQELRLPDLGGDVDEVTITRWFFEEGASFKKGDILLEIATDKVDTEVPADVGGTLVRKLAKEGDLVSNHAVIGEFVTGEEAMSSSPEQEDESAAVSSDNATSDVSEVKATPVAEKLAQDAGIQLAGMEGSGLGGRITKRDVLAVIQEGPTEVNAPHPKRTTETGVTALPHDLDNQIDPVVQRMAAEYQIDLRQLAGGRPLSALTKYDVLGALGREGGPRVPKKPSQTSPPPPASSEQERQPRSSHDVKISPAPLPPASKQETAVAAEGLLPHSRIRKLTAANTARSFTTIPHVTTWWDVDMSAVLAHRRQHKEEFAAKGVRLTFTPYFIQAIVDALKTVPIANSSWSDEGLILKNAYHIGMAVALDGGGLIVPVIKNADELSLIGLARVVNDLAERGRSQELSLSELQGGTFTLTNYGTSGSRFQTPIIIEGQAGILGVGAVEKRPVVVSQGHPLEANTGDYLAFLPMVTLGFSYDHRILDGATADAFCAAVKSALTSW